MENSNGKTLLEAYTENKDIALDFQKTLIGILITGLCNRNDVIFKLKDAWFINDTQRKVYTTVKQAILDNHDITSHLISSGEKSSNIADYHYIVSSGTYISADVDKLIIALKKCYKRDKFFTLIDEFNYLYINDAQDPDEMIQRAYSSLTDLASTDDNTTTIDEVFDEFYRVQDEFLNKRDGEYIGVPTGFKKLDDIIDGLRPGHLWVIGAYTSAGKTWFALNMLNNVLDKAHSCLFSLEMSRVEIINRLLAVGSNIPATIILRGELNDEEKQVISTVKKRIVDSKVSIYDKQLELDELILLMTYEIIKKKTSIFFVDYLQLITVKKAKGEYEETSRISKRLQSFARDMGVTIVILSQINNDHARLPNKEVIGFKGGGTIAASADIAIELVNENKKDERDERYVNGLPYDVTAAVKKNRHGRTGEIDLDFMPRTGVFTQRKQTYDDF